MFRPGRTPESGTADFDKVKVLCLNFVYAFRRQLFRESGALKLGTVGSEKVMIPRLHRVILFKTTLQEGLDNPIQDSALAHSKCFMKIFYFVLQKPSLGGVEALQSGIVCF